MIDYGLVTGSSPRMQGAADDPLRRIEGCRIIPAHAGSSCVEANIPSAMKDHPRACREQNNQNGMWTFMAGSSPRMQGAVVGSSETSGRMGIIPAHAGSRRFETATQKRTSDHPRACREQRHLGTKSTDDQGSSPRMQGAGHRSWQLRRWSRIIPAHAGSSRGVPRLPRQGQDHPRACREQDFKQRGKEDAAGSSPRMQGAVFERPVFRGKLRIIPAHAGSSTVFESDGDDE